LTEHPGRTEISEEKYQHRGIGQVVDQSPSMLYRKTNLDIVLSDQVISKNGAIID
jgi:hypothetical protein